MYKFLNNNKILVISHIADIDGMGGVILENLPLDKSQLKKY